MSGPTRVAVYGARADDTAGGVHLRSLYCRGLYEPPSGREGDRVSGGRSHRMLKPQRYSRSAIPDGAYFYANCGGGTIPPYPPFTQGRLVWRGFGGGGVHLRLLYMTPHPSTFGCHLPPLGKVNVRRPCGAGRGFYVSEAIACASEATIEVSS